RNQNVVAIEIKNVITGGNLRAVIPGPRHASICRHGTQTHLLTILVQYLRRTIRGAIVDDDHLVSALYERRLDRLTNEGLLIEAGDDDTEPATSHPICLSSACGPPAKPPPELW